MIINKPTNHVGLIVRGKRDKEHVPTMMEQHADCILSTGEPIGYFFAGAPFGLSSSAFPSSVFQSIDPNRKGVVIDYRTMRRLLPHFTDAYRAKQLGCPSTVLLIETTDAKAREFDNYWRIQRNNPGGFYIFGGNCSSYASRAFRHAGIVDSGISGMDTPNNLCRQLLAHPSLNVKTYSGYVGFTDENGKLALQIL